MSEPSTPAQLENIEVYVLIDENGEHVVSTTIDDLAEKYNRYIGGDADLARRIVRLDVAIPLPRIAVVSAEAPDQDDAGLSMRAK